MQSLYFVKVQEHKDQEVHIVLHLKLLPKIRWETEYMLLKQNMVEGDSI